MNLPDLENNANATTANVNMADSSYPRFPSVCNCGCLRPRRIVQVFLPNRLDLYIFERDNDKREHIKKSAENV